MTRAIDTLRQSGGFVDLRATNVFERLAILEGRRRVELFQRARPHAAPDLAHAIGAFRLLCPNLESRACARDAQALSGSEADLVHAWLDISGVAGDDADAWFALARDRQGIYLTEDGWFTDEVFFCELHEVWYSRRTPSHQVVVRWHNGIRDTEIWSDEAVEESAFYCDGSQRYYASCAFDAGQTLDGDPICETWAELNGYWSDPSGNWRNDDPDDFADDCAIPAYHDADRNWSLVTARQAPIAYYGLEIELYFDDEHARLEYFEEAGFPTGDLTAERDGSLDEDEGLEVISRPFSLAEQQQHRNP